MFNNKFFLRRRRYIRRTGRRGPFRIRSRTGMVKRTIRNMAESKFNVWAFNGLVTTNGWTDASNNSLYYFSDITPEFPTGVNKNARIGNTIQYSWVTLRLNLGLMFSTAGTVPPESCYYVRVIFYQNRLNVTTVGDILAGIADNATYEQRASPSNTVLPVWNQNVRVLNDEIFPMFGNTALNGQTSYYSGNPGGVSVKWQHKVNNKVQFRSSDVVDPGDPHDQYGILILVRGNRAPNASTTPAVNCYFTGCTKVSYTDV